MTRSATSACLTGLLALALLLTGCQSPTSPATADRAPRFHEGSRADVVLRFNRWDTIHLLRPDSRQGGFLPILTRENLGAELQRRQVKQDLAVVLLGRLLPDSLATQYATEWVTLLSGLGFQRTVILRGGTSDDIDGLPVIRDSAIAAAHDQATAVLAALPPAARADVAHPSRH